MDTVIRLERHVQAMFKTLLKERLPVTPVTKTLIHSLFHVSTHLDVLSSRMADGDVTDMNEVQEDVTQFTRSLQSLETEAFALEHLVPFRFLKLITTAKNEIGNISANN